MTSPAYSILYSAVVSATAGTGSPGDVLLPDATSGDFVKATTANRGTRRSTGIALHAYVASGVVDIQQEGFVAATLSGLGAGTASLVRCSATGTLERVASPGATDDVVGWCETDGALHLRCGQSPGGYGYGAAGYTAPTGDGYPHITAGAQDAAAVSLTWTGDATGTGTGSSFALTVGKVNGVTYPTVVAGGTVGNSAYVSAASTAAYSALNLAGGAGWVTGVLPTANQASQAMAGDVTGTTAAAVVAKVNSVTYPTVVAGGTVGNSAYISAASTVAYSALNLAGGAGWVTGLLPVTNIAAGTNTYVLTTTGGVTGWAAPSGGSPGGSSGEIQYNSSGAFAGITGITGGVGYIGLGASLLAASGAIRSPTAGAAWMMRDSINSGDYGIVHAVADNAYFGTDSTFTKQVSAANLYALSAVGIGIGGTTYQYITGSKIESWVPRTGSSLGSSPYASDGHSSIAFAGAGNLTVAAADYALSSNVFTGARTATGTATYPAATDAGAYYKWVQNSTTGGFNVTITTGAGTTQAIGAGGPPHYFRFDASGIVLLV